MKILDEVTFKEQVFDYEATGDVKLKGDLPVIVDFYADWCGPCQRLAPILEDVAKEYEGKIRVYKVDTEKSEALSEVFRIQTIPTLLFVPKEGKPSQVSGIIPRNTLLEAIEKMLHVKKYP